jgi:hypothetical protein
MSSFERKSEKFLRWLSKNQYKIYSSSVFNDFAAVFKNELRIYCNARFVIKFPFEPFVLLFDEYISNNPQRYEVLNSYGLDTAKLGIPYIIIHDSNIDQKDIPSVLLIRIDQLKDRTDIFTGGVRNRKLFFEDALWKRCLEMKNNKNFVGIPNV